MVVGAYKAILVWNLEVETLVLLLDLYLNKRLAEFESRLAQSGLQTVIDNVRLKILRRFGKRRRRGYRRMFLNIATKAFRPIDLDQV